SPRSTASPRSRSRCSAPSLRPERRSCASVSRSRSRRCAPPRRGSATSRAMQAAESGDRGRLMRLAGGASVTVALVLIIMKAWAYAASGSVALLGSLADSLLDLAASVITLLAVRFALTPADREHRFGHGKSEGVAGLVQAL